MPSQLTITAKTGPAMTVTALVLRNVTDLDFQLGGKSILRVESDNGIDYFDISADSTVTFTLASGVGTVVVS